MEKTVVGVALVVVVVVVVFQNPRFWMTAIQTIKGRAQREGQARHRITVSERRQNTTQFPGEMLLATSRGKQMKPFLRVLVLLSASLPFATSLSAQRPLKRIFVTVSDQAGAPLLDLSPGAFDVTEGGKKVEVVRASLVKEPMRIALLVDTSAESAASQTSIRGGLQAFLEGIPPQDEILLMSTGGQARVRVAPTLDRKKLTSAVGALFSDGGSAVLLDALRESWTLFLRDAKDRWPVIVAVGTSGPDSSGTTNPQLQVLIREIQSAAANVHVIMLTRAQPLGASNGFTAVTASLNVTSYSGGHYEALPASSALPGRMAKLAEQIAAQQKRVGTQYAVDFVSQSTDPQAQVGVYVAREGAGVGLSMGRPIE